MDKLKKPLIGVTPLVDIQRESLWMLPGYMDGLLQAGAVPVMLPLTSDREILTQLTGHLDGFLFTGGQDVSPEIYKGIKLNICGECCPERDSMETELLNIAMDTDRPVLGICRGIQFINAALGGTLYQDIPTQLPSTVEHHQTPPYDRPSHEVRIINGTPLYDLFRREHINVNSYHHSGVCELSPRLKCMALSEDGLAEAVYCPEQTFLWAVQWHPEFSYKVSEESREIFSAFVRACKRDTI